MQVETKYIAKDGKKFDSPEEAAAHEAEYDRKAQERYTKFITTSYSGKRLMERYSSSQYGVWHVVGESDDPGPGGGRGNNMGFVEGKLEDVIRWATAQNAFWAWGGGGDITKIEVKKI